MACCDPAHRYKVSSLMIQGPDSDGQTLDYFVTTPESGQILSYLMPFMMTAEGPLDQMLQDARTVDIPVSGDRRELVETLGRRFAQNHSAWDGEDQRVTLSTLSHAIHCHMVPRRRPAHVVQCGVVVMRMCTRSLWFGRAWGHMPVSPSACGPGCLAW